MKRFDHVPPQYPTMATSPEATPRRLAFVGEAPSYEEMREGQPLVGPDGRIFNSLLRTAGLDRYEFFITNVFDEQLPDNQVSNWTVGVAEAKASGVTDLPPIEGGWLAREHRWHFERLRKELVTFRPNVVVPLGGTALWALTGQANIGSYRGTILASKGLLPGLKLLPTFHPGFVRKQWKFFPVLVGDFLRAYRQSAFPEIRLPLRRLLIEPTIEDVRSYVPRLLASDLLSVDIETAFKQITSIGFAPSAEEGITIPFVDRRQISRSYWKTEQEEREVWSLVKQVMESPTPKVGQNFAGYDAYWFMMAGIQPRNLVHDTRLIHHALYPELPKGLEFMGAGYTEQGAWKGWGGHRKKKDKKDD